MRLPKCTAGLLALLSVLLLAAPAATAGWSANKADAPAAGADTAASSAMQAMLDKHAQKMTGELEAQLDGLLQQQRELLLKAPVVAGGKFEADYYTKASRRAAFLTGLLTAAVILGAVGWGWVQFNAKRTSILREAAADAVLEVQKPDVVRRLIAQVTRQRELPSWIAFPDFERVEWINGVLTQLWPHAAAAVVAQVREQLDPQLKAAKPKWIGDIAITEFTFGEAPPRVKGIKVYPGEKTGDDVVIETDAVWASSMSVTLRVRLLPERLPVLGSISVTSWVTKFLSKLVFVKMGVTKVGFSGRVRVAMTGISDKMPVVGSLQVSLVEMPRFSFGITLYEYLNLMVLPGLEAFVHFFIRDILLRPYILPESITIPLVPGAGGHLVPRGLLFVNVIEAVNIPNLDWRSLLSKPDTFVELSVRARVSKKTRVVWNSRCPKWNEEFRFLIHFPEHQELLVVLKDHDRLLGDTEIGRVHIPIKAVPPNEEQDLWTEVQLTHKGFMSLKALKGAMSAMSMQRPGRGSRVAQVSDPGGMGFSNVESGAPEVHEITPPDELPSDEEDPLLESQQQEQFQALPGSPAADAAQQDAPQQTAAQQTSAQQQGGGGGSAVDHISELASVPGVCQAGEGTCDRHDQDSSTPVVPADIQRQSSSDPGGAAVGSSRGSPAEAGSSGATPRTSASVDEQVAAARRRRQHKEKDTCKLHLKLTYVQVGEETVRKAREAGEAAQHGDRFPSSQLAPADSQEAKILNALRGGVLEVKLHRPHVHDGVQPARQVVVRVGERQKATAAAKGVKEEDAIATDEVLDFVVDGDLADDPDASVVLEVYDQHWITDTEEANLWGWEARGQMPTEPARVSVPLHAITSAKKLHKAWEIAADGHALLLDVEFEWLAVLDNGGS